jgi:preprotein translocase subunit SecG
MHTFLVIVQVLVAITLIGFILLQQGKGADAGAAFGSGSSGTVFGSRGAANFLSRTTAILAAVFFLVSLSLAYFVSGLSSSESVIEKLGAEQAPVVAPAIPEPEATAPAAAVEPAQTPAVPE